MAAIDFLRQFGFLRDPFESTNAEREPNLSDYFVPPPYFTSVMGDPGDPKSQVILAPRGGGKTAQRRMIEERSAKDDSFLCITYDRFDQPAGFTLDQATLSYHLNHLCRLILVGILIQLDRTPLLAETLTDQQKKVLKWQMEHFLGGMSESEFQEACDSLKNFGDRARDFWKKWGTPISVVIAMVMKGAGVDAKVVTDSDGPRLTRRDDSLSYHFQILLELVRHFGFNATYVLVDKVDEIAETNASASAAFALIKGLLTDLPTLETPHVAFKFFLWDQIDSDYREQGARPDRVPVYHLQWTFAELERMLTARLQAYSQNRVSSLNDLLCDDVGVDVHKLVACLAAGSPRDMIRMAKRVVAEQTRMSASARCLDEGGLWEGIRIFCRERSDELFGHRLVDLRRIGTPTFTINHLASEVFRVSQQAVRAKVQGWQDAGMVAKVGEVPNPPNRPLYLFAVTDLRVAVAMQAGTPVQKVLDSIVIECPHCASICCSDRDDVNCGSCSREFSRSEARTLLQACSRTTGP